MESNPERKRSGDDQRKRLTIAIACSLAIHEIVAGFVPSGRRPAAPPSPDIAQTITIVQRPRPTPRPTPPPKPPVVPPAPRTTLAPQIVVRAPAPPAILPRRRHAGGKASHRIVRATPHPLLASARPIAIETGSALGVANGGAGSGAGAGSGGAGRGRGAAGGGGSGIAPGGETNTSPCGSVYFVPVHHEVNHDGSIVVTVAIEVTLRDGQTVRDLLGWPFVYASSQADPFSANNADDAIRMQLPPAGYDVARQKPAVAIAIKETGADGNTQLLDCPTK